jgi:hypothetical protein
LKKVFAPPRFRPQTLKKFAFQNRKIFHSFLKKKSARAKSKKCGKIFQFWIFAKQKGGSGIIFLISFFLYFWPPASHPAQRWRQDGIPHILKMKKCWIGGVLYAIN